MERFRNYTFFSKVSMTPTFMPLLPAPCVLSIPPSRVCSVSGEPGSQLAPQTFPLCGDAGACASSPGLFPAECAAHASRALHWTDPHRGLDRTP